MARSFKRLNSTNMIQVDTALLCFNYVRSILMEIQMRRLHQDYMILVII